MNSLDSFYKSFIPNDILPATSLHLLPPFTPNLPAFCPHLIVYWNRLCTLLKDLRPPLTSLHLFYVCLSHFLIPGEKYLIPQFKGRGIYLGSHLQAIVNWLHGRTAQHRSMTEEQLLTARQSGCIERTEELGRKIHHLTESCTSDSLLTRHHFSCPSQLQYLYI